MLFKENSEFTNKRTHLKKVAFWVVFAVFLALAVTPLIIMYDQIEAEVGYWFSDNSMVVDESSFLDTEKLLEKTVLGINRADYKNLSYSEIAILDSDRDGIPDYLEVNFFGTDPHKWDTDGDGYSDWEEIVNGYDPLSPSKQRVSPNEYWDQGSLPKLIKIATAYMSLRDWWDGNTYGAKNLSRNITGIDHLAKNYSLNINKINTRAPVIMLTSRDENEIYEGLKSGYVHYKGTAFPGEEGDGVYFCHSSTRYGSSGDYDTLCANLEKLERGDEIVINSEDSELRYIVTSRTNDFNPSDPKIFRKTQRPTISIVSCWPVGTNRYRIVVRAELISL